MDGVEAEGVLEGRPVGHLQHQRHCGCMQPVSARIGCAHDADPCAVASCTATLLSLSRVRPQTCSQPARSGPELDTCTGLTSAQPAAAELTRSHPHACKRPWHLQKPLSSSRRMVFQRKHRQGAGKACVLTCWRCSGDFYACICLGAGGPLLAAPGLPALLGRPLLRS